MNYQDLIKAKVIEDSITQRGDRLTTMEIEYPRFILAELNTHRMLSKNSASSRAIPSKAMLEHIRNNTAGPVFWGKNQSGMQAKEELTGKALEDAKYMWQAARDDALRWVEAILERTGLHKQITNRISEPWSITKTVISGTDAGYANLFWLRYHPDAQPEFGELARKMYEAYSASKPQTLRHGHWHMPYVPGHIHPGTFEQVFTDNQGNEISLEDALVISASCCAQVSYRKNDDSLEKAKDIFQRLIGSAPVHASPVEHQATPIRYNNYHTETPLWDRGITHRDRKGQLWSGNFCGWIQHRKLIHGEALWDINEFKPPIQ